MLFVIQCHLSSCNSFPPTLISSGISSNLYKIMVILPSFHLTIPNMMKRKGLDIASYAFSSFRIANTISQPPTICGCYHHGFHGNISWNIFAVSYCLFPFFMSVHLSFRGIGILLKTLWISFLVYTMLSSSLFYIQLFLYLQHPMFISLFKDFGS